MSDSPDAAALVACLCAAWCRTCDEYRGVFETLRAEFGARAQFVWVDIEDDEAVLGELDIEDFPTLALVRGERITFFGPVLPHPQTARQLIERGLRDELPPVNDTTLAGLPARLRTLARA
jgi:thioredoxin 1